MDVGSGNRFSIRIKDAARDGRKVLVLYPQIDVHRAGAVDRDPGKVPLILLQSGCVSAGVTALLRKWSSFRAGHVFIGGPGDDIVLTVGHAIEDEFSIRVRQSRRDGV